MQWLNKLSFKKVLLMYLFIFYIIINSFSLDIKLKFEDNIKLKDGVIVTVILENNSSEYELIPILFVPETYFIQFNIVDLNNVRIPYLGPEFKLSITCESMIYMKPGDSYITKLDLSKLYKNLTPGSYTIDAIYHNNYDWGEEKLWQGSAYSKKHTVLIE